MSSDRDPSKHFFMRKTFQYLSDVVILVKVHSKSSLNVSKLTQDRQKRRSHSDPDASVFVVIKFSLNDTIKELDCRM